MKHLTSTVLFFIISSMLIAQYKPVLLFPNGAPGEVQKLQQTDDLSGRFVAGEPVLRISDVSEPTISFYPAPQQNNSGTTIIVAPGGGYNILAYDLEGSEICEWFNERGVNCVLLKYRVPRRDGLEKHEAPLQDMQQAIAYTRAHAAEWGVDADRVGVMGFSAGAHLAVMASTAYEDEALRPNFTLLVYPAYLDGENFQLSPEIKVTPQTPPTFLVQTQDDHSFIDSSLYYYYALKEQGVPVGMNLYPSGGHGYGLRNTGHWVNEWPERVMRWLGTVLDSNI